MQKNLCVRVKGDHLEIREEKMMFGEQPDPSVIGNTNVELLVFFFY